MFLHVTTFPLLNDRKSQVVQKNACKGIKIFEWGGEFQKHNFSKAKLEFPEGWGEGVQTKNLWNHRFFFIHVALSGQPHTSWDFERFMNSLFSKIIVH